MAHMGVEFRKRLLDGLWALQNERTIEAAEHIYPPFKFHHWDKFGPDGTLLVLHGPKKEDTGQVPVISVGPRFRIVDDCNCPDDCLDSSFQRCGCDHGNAMEELRREFGEDTECN